MCMELRVDGQGLLRILVFDLICLIMVGFWDLLFRFVLGGMGVGSLICLSVGACLGLGWSWWLL